MTSNSNHSYVTNGKRFYTANVVDKPRCEDHDMTAIFMERDGESPLLVDYYYGSPQLDITKQYVDRWLRHRKTNYYDVANKANSDDVFKMIAEAEVVKQMLTYCSVCPGAKITISVEHDDGHKATANLYDMAALVQSLFMALEEFQDEMS